MPESFEGVLVANELLDAMPVHQVVMREDGLREIYVESHGSELRLREGPLSTPRLTEYFAAIGASLEPGWRAEVSLAAIDWVREASRRLKRGFIILIDYGHDAAELYSVTHSAGTLTSFAQHRSAGPESADGTLVARAGRTGSHGACRLHERSAAPQKRKGARRSAFSIRCISCWRSSPIGWRRST